MEPINHLVEIEGRLKQSIEEHSTLPDGFWYTTMTVLPLAFTAFSTVAAKIDGLSTWVSIASALAALCISLERALGFGARWRYHREMKSGYRNLLDGVAFVNTLPEERRQAFLNDWWAKLLAMRGREGDHGESPLRSG